MAGGAKGAEEAGGSGGYSTSTENNRQQSALLEWANISKKVLFIPVVWFWMDFSVDTSMVIML